VSETRAELARRTPERLVADPSRVITRLFVPGQETFDRDDSRTSPVLDRILALDEDEVATALDDVSNRFRDRHRNLDGTFRRHADGLAGRLGARGGLSTARRSLLGASFTSEYAIEGAALCNPSIVAHPDQADVPSGSLRFVMSVRGIGEGHLSSIGFRTGMIDGRGEPRLDPRRRFAATGQVETVSFEAATFRCELQRLGGSGESSAYVLDPLGDRFTAAALDAQLERLQGDLATRRHAGHTISLIRAIAERTYGVHFAADTPLAERVLWPAMAAEDHGMEDARFVRFTDEDDTATYFATYTAYDGSAISQQLLETTDFAAFTSSPVVGPAAANKGLALFPRRVGGRYAALSRFDRESNWIAFSDSLRHWDTPQLCQVPARPWEVLQLGNCGSPIETDAGWLVLTHGVGPMRTYSIGVILLDRDDPTRILGQLREPLLSPAPDERDGYVPNVIYSCGALVHARTLVVPYGMSDNAIGLATVPLPELLDALQATGRRPPLAAR
jgi:predicted GH43/DUF377 family glycosyl hydrolase